MKKILVPFALTLVCLVSCNKDFGTYFDQDLIEFPPVGIEDVNLISQEDDLYNYLTLTATQKDTLTDVGCIEFIYPFVLFQYDEADTYLNQVSVLGNEDFTAILNELEKGYSIGLSYPINGNLIDGTPVTVTSNKELQESLATCIEEELEIIIGNCNAIVEDCVWKVTESAPIDSLYFDSFFRLREDGSVVFSVPQALDPDALDEEDEEENPDNVKPTYDSETGTWIFYFIGPDLHININFGPFELDENGMVMEQDSIKSDWNFDWKVNYIDLEKIKIEKTDIPINSTENGEVIEDAPITEEFTLEKVCDDEPIEEN